MIETWLAKYYTLEQSKKDGKAAGWQYDWRPIMSNTTFCSCCGTTYIDPKVATKPDFHPGIMLMPGIIGKAGEQPDGSTTEHIKTKNGDITLNMFYIDSSAEPITDPDDDDAWGDEYDN